MLTINRTKRLEVYKKVLKRFKNMYACECGICPALIDELGFRTSESEDYKYLERWFPEFWSQKPKDKNAGGWWWSSRDLESRIQALKNCIKMIEL